MDMQGYLHGLAFPQGFEEFDVPAKYISSHMADTTTKHSVHKIGVGAMGSTPIQFDVGVPCIMVNPLSHGTSQLPQVGAIHVTCKQEGFILCQLVG